MLTIFPCFLSQNGCFASVLCYRSVSFRTIPYKCSYRNRSCLRSCPSSFSKRLIRCYCNFLLHIIFWIQWQKFANKTKIKKKFPFQKSIKANFPSDFFHPELFNSDEKKKANSDAEVCLENAK